MFGNREESGTRTLAIESSEVIEALKLNFPWRSLDVNPSIPFSKRNPLTTPSSSRAQTSATSAKEPFVIHILFPFITQSSPSLVQVVIIPPGLDPKLDSVNPKQPNRFPEPSPGNHFSFCSSDP